VRIAALSLMLLPCAAVAQDDWFYTPVVTACFATNDRACIGAAASMCMEDEDDGETTLGAMTCLLAEAEAWDDLLNLEYAVARDHARALDAADAADFPEFAIRADQVQAAQRAWIAFRDANCAMEYGLWGAGSLRQIAGGNCRLRMTATRSYELREYYNNAP
jgi:uncharacterized protein YecT (DUF1311 family)